MCRLSSFDVLPSKLENACTSMLNVKLGYVLWGRPAYIWGHGMRGK
jgi:hypothetical protein